MPTWAEANAMIRRGQVPISADQSGSTALVTPDGRFLVVRGRLWRRTDPALPAGRRSDLVRELMAARRSVAVAKRSGDREAETLAHAAVDRAKRSLGERGPVWWDDGTPDLTRRMARTTVYADWYAPAVAKRKSNV